MSRSVVRKPKSRGLGGERGSVSVEYTVVLCLVALVCALAVITLGPPLVGTYELRLTLLLLPFP